MGRPPRISFPGAIYHAMARGNAQQKIFLCPGDWTYFLDILAHSKTLRNFKLHAYCLMPNHIHLLVEPIEANISTIMGSLLNRFAKHLNARLDRKGHVFQDRFKAPLCRNNSHLLQLVRYIHLNPVAGGLAAEPSAWPFSGHLEYLGKSPVRLIDPQLVLSLFHASSDSAREEYQKFVLNENNPIDQDTSPGILPTIPESAPTECISLTKTQMSLAEVASVRAIAAGISQQVLRSQSRIRRVCKARHAFIHQAFQAGYSLTDIAGYLSLTVSMVSRILIKKVQQVQ
ncbi:MAG TPA: hypothetical protein DEB40_01195 [Elusimicrobia bacterium]|nr:hypothetical protein [Elusimicrobiota bacterium]HBT60345.1 hypothetical protein [Elusimicrobiota bacterium]